MEFSEEMTTVIERLMMIEKRYLELNEELMNLKKKNNLNNIIIIILLIILLIVSLVAVYVRVV